MNLIQQLENQRTEILSRALGALTKARLAHYEEVGIDTLTDP
jgi:hypothetical protein